MSNGTREEINSEDETIQIRPEELLLIEIAMNVQERFEHRRDKERLIESALEVAKELIAKRPAVTEFIGELSIAAGRARGQPRLVAFA